MTSEAVDHAKRGFEAYRRAYHSGDWESLRELIHPDFEWHVAQGLVVERGLEGMEAATRSWQEAFEWWDLEYTDFVDAGDAVVVATRARGKSRSTGAIVEDRYYLVCRLRDGKLWRMHHYGDRREAARAAGLEELPV
jgi:ketosteroid isomerase-like protein